MEEAIKARIECRCVRRWIVGGLIDDQVADCTGLRIKDEATGLRIRGRIADGLATRAVRIERHRLRRVEGAGRNQAREGVVGSTEFTLAGYQIVEASINR